MPERIPKSVAKKVVFRAIASADHFSPATSKTIAITISKNAGAFGNPAAGATNATEMSSGFYAFDLGTGDTGTGGPLAWRGAGTGIDDVGDVYEVVNATNAGFTALPDVASGASGAVIVSGSNAGTTTLAALTVTGATTYTGHVSYADGVAIAAPSTAGRHGLAITGNAAGAGMILTGGNAAPGLYVVASAESAAKFDGAGSGNAGLEITGTGAGTYGLLAAGAAAGIQASGNAAAGIGLNVVGNTSGAGLSATGGNAGHGAIVTAGGGNSDGLRLGGTGSGHGLSAAGAGGGTGHGILATSGSGATGDGLRAVSAATAGNGMYLAGAGAAGDGLEAVAGGGVPIRGDITGNITGNITGTIATVTNLTNDAAKYMHGAVWVDTVNGASGTASYTNGIATNPSSTIANAKTIADNLKLKRFWIQSGSSLTLGAAMVGYVFDGAGYTLDLNGKDISKAIIHNVEGMIGTGICTTGEAIVRNCHLGPTAITIGEVDFNDCHLMGTVTMSQASVPYLFNKCIGVSAPKIVFAAANQSAVISKWSGPLTIAGMVSTNTLYIDGDGDVTFDNTNNTGTVYINGAIRLTNSGASMNITDTSRWGEDQTIATATNVTTVNGLAANVITAASIATDAGAEIADAVWDEAIAGHAGAGSTGAALAAATAPSAADVADAVWDEIIAGHAGVGSTGAALSAAGGSGDPWATALPGAYGAGTAGKIVGDYIDAAISDVPTAIENADALLNRDMSTGTDSGSPTVRTPRQALRFLRNKWVLTGTALSVKKEDDTAESWSAVVTTSAGADPISGSDPA